MVDNLHKAEKEDEKSKTEAKPDVITDGKGGRVRSTASKGATDGATSHLNRTLVVPIYVVALEYDDFMQAVREGDKEWHDFFKEHPNYWEQKDRFRVVGDDHSKRRLEPDPDYVLPRNASPPREAGRWETHDGPWVDDDKEVVRLSEAIRANVVAVRKKRAAISREKGVVDEGLMPLLEEQRRLRIEERKERARAANDRFRFATRPAVRMRDSWLKDRYEFGRLRADSERDGASNPADVFKQQVVEWERMYAEWLGDEALLADHDALNQAIGEHTAALRDASLHLCWGLSQLASAKAKPEELYASDGELPLLDDAALVRQRMQRDDGGNPFRSVRTRLTLPLFLLDVLDNLDEVQVHTRWFADKHAAVRSDAFRSRPRNAHRYLSALHAIETPNWPDAQRMDCITRAAGGVLGGIIAHLGTHLGADDWSGLKGRIDDLLRAASTDHDDLLRAASTDHVLTLAHRPTLRIILAEWATRIVQERTNSLFTDNDEHTRVAWDTLKRTAVAPLSGVGVLRRDAAARIADLHAAAILFGLEECPEMSPRWLPAGPSTVLRYARELQLVGGLLVAQRNLVADTQVFGNDLAVRSSNYERAAPNRKDYVLISYTADAFSRLFLSVKEDALVKLNELLMNAIDGNVNNEVLLLAAESRDRYYAELVAGARVEGKPSDHDVPDAFYSALEIVRRALGAYGGVTRKRAEENARRLQSFYEQWRRAHRALTEKQKALVGALSPLAEDDVAMRERLQTAMNENNARMVKATHLLASLENIIKSGDQLAISNALRELDKKRRHGESRGQLDALADAALADAPQAPGSSSADAAQVPAAPQEPGSSSADVPMTDADLLPDDDDPYGHGRPIDVDDWGMFGHGQLEAFQAALSELNTKPVDHEEVEKLDKLLNPATTTQSAFEFANMAIAPNHASSPDDDAKAKMRKDVMESAKRDALAPYVQLDERLAAQTQAQRARLASLRKERAAADAALRRAVASARAELLAPDALDAEAWEQRRARLNAALRDVETSPSSGADDDHLSYSTYLARLEGFGIDDPTACNDDDLAVIDKNELWGWKGQYRRYVARLLRVVDGHWSVDEAVLSPAEWLERGGNSRFAPGPPRPSQARVDAADAADAAALRTASLEQAVEGIVGLAGGEDAARVEATLSHLLEADRRCMQRVDWPWHAPFAFDFDGYDPSSIVARAQ